MHPEMGHIRVPHDRASDPFEAPARSMATVSKVSLPDRRSRPGGALPARDLPAEPPRDRAGSQVSRARAGELGLHVVAATDRDGGGVMQQAHLFPLIRQELLRLLNGYIEAREITDCMDRYVVPAGLGSRAGVLGALVLAEEAARFERLRRTRPLGLRSILKLAGKGDAKVALVFGRNAADCHRAVLHVREGAPDVPVWLFSTTEPSAETADAV